MATFKKILAIMLAMLVCYSSYTNVRSSKKVEEEASTISNELLDEFLEARAYFHFFNLAPKHLLATIASQIPNAVTFRFFNLTWFDLPCFEQVIASTQKHYFVSERIIHFRATTLNLIFPFNYFW